MLFFVLGCSVDSEGKDSGITRRKASLLEAKSAAFILMHDLVAGPLLVPLVRVLLRPTRCAAVEAVPVGPGAVLSESYMAELPQLSIACWSYKQAALSVGSCMLASYFVVFVVFIKARPRVSGIFYAGKIDVIFPPRYEIFARLAWAVVAVLSVLLAGWELAYYAGFTASAGLLWLLQQYMRPCNLRQINTLNLAGSSAAVSISVIGLISIGVGWRASYLQLAALAGGLAMTISVLPCLVACLRKKIETPAGSLAEFDYRYDFYSKIEFENRPWLTFINALLRFGLTAGLVGLVVVVWFQRVDECIAQAHGPCLDATFQCNDTKFSFVCSCAPGHRPIAERQNTTCRPFDCGPFKPPGGRSPNANYSGCTGLSHGPDGHDTRTLFGDSSLCAAGCDPGTFAVAALNTPTDGAGQFSCGPEGRWAGQLRCDSCPKVQHCVGKVTCAASNPLAQDSVCVGGKCHEGYTGPSCKKICKPIEHCTKVECSTDFDEKCTTCEAGYRTTKQARRDVCGPVPCPHWHDPLDSHLEPVSASRSCSQIENAKYTGGGCTLRCADGYYSAQPLSRVDATYICNISGAWQLKSGDRELDCQQCTSTPHCSPATSSTTCSGPSANVTSCANCLSGYIREQYGHTVGNDGHTKERSLYKCLPRSCPQHGQDTNQQFLCNGTIKYSMNGTCIGTCVAGTRETGPTAYGLPHKYRCGNNGVLKPVPGGSRLACQVCPPITNCARENTTCGEHKAQAPKTMSRCEGCLTNYALVPGTMASPDKCEKVICPNQMTDHPEFKKIKAHFTVPDQVMKLSFHCVINVSDVTVH